MRAPVLSGGGVDVEIRVIDVRRFRVTVGNEIVRGDVLPSNPFERGARGGQDQEGSGVGLCMAQLVARQHDTQIVYRRNRLQEYDRVEFEFVMTSVD